MKPSNYYDNKKENEQYIADNGDYAIFIFSLLFALFLVWIF